ncbi:hypothetical protein A0256_16995 [Mucilaginibacter sp. PAMC 26640]|nr:hypothetical protein A0256_16995 [Mucilaginibacter sp. PAMC 26640]
MINSGIISLIEQRLSVTIANSSPVSGGDINAVYGLQTTAAKYLLKVNSAGKFPNMFLREQEGLYAMAATQTVRIPKVYLHDEVDGESFLLMEWIESKRATPAGSANLGRKLSAMHRYTSGSFGFDQDNYIGSLHQSNKQQSNWANFYITERLQPLLSSAIKKQQLNDSDQAQFNRLYQQLPDLFVPEAPALLHGDLWSGNYLIDTNDEPCLIDPAVYYGHREMDLALTTLFGGFSPEFYKNYQETYPLAKGWEQRLDLWNLYPLLVHVNLFGGAYVQQLRGSLKKILTR